MAVDRDKELKLKDIALEERRVQVARMLTLGATHRQIAKELGVSPGTVARDRKIALRRLWDESCVDTRELVTLSKQRLEVAIRALMPGVQSGDIRDIEALVKVEARLAKMLGYDEGVLHIEHTGPDGGPIAVAAMTAGQMIERYGTAIAEALEMDGPETNDTA